MYIRSNVNKQEVLTKVGKNTLRFLRESVGFDFEKPVIINMVKGQFTVKKIWDLIPHKNYDYSVVILLHDAYSKYERKQRYYAVKLTGLDFQIELKSATYFSDYHTYPETYFRKGDFNEQRKDPSTEAFIIAQRNDYIMPISEKTPYETHTLNDNERYKFISDSYTWYSDMSAKYLSKIDLKDTNGKGNIIHYRVPTYNREKFVLSDILDASGYFVLNRREELKRRAQALRAERAKTAYMKADTSGKIQEVIQAAKELNEQLSEQLKRACSYETAYQIHRTIYDLAWIYKEIELFTDRTNQKLYSSIETSEKAYNSIMNKINNMKGVR